MRAARRSGDGMGVAELAISLVSGGFGFVVADGLDRFLATYNPSAEGELPKDKFTSDGAGTLANTLNVASPPGIARVAAGIGMTALPAVAAMYSKGPYMRRSLEGVAIGSGASLFKMLWNNVVMPMLKPKDTSAAAMRKSYIARLYPAEVSAAINREAKQTAVSSGGGAGALSGAGDVGPFALQGPESYPNAAEALRAATGVRGTPGNGFPTVQNTWGTGEESYPTAQQALYKKEGVVGADWEPGPPPLPGPGPQAAPGEDPACGCIGESNQFLGFVGDEGDDKVFPLTG